MIFNHPPRLIHTFDEDIMPPEQELRFLPQLFRADLDMAWRIGGIVVRDVIAQIGFASRWKYLSVDTRVHMLMKGMFPCIPGWHCDDFYRPDGYPALDRVMKEAPAEHASMILGGCSRTVFITTPVEVDIPRGCNWSVGTIYGRAHKQIEEADFGGERRTVNPGELFHFSPLTWHRGSPATANGWRYFIRVTGSNHLEPLNEIRTHAQVYMTEPFAGW